MTYLLNSLSLPPVLDDTQLACRPVHLFLGYTLHNSEADWSRAAIFLRSVLAKF